MKDIREIASDVTMSKLTEEMLVQRHRTFGGHFAFSDTIHDIARLTSLTERINDYYPENRVMYWGLRDNGTELFDDLEDLRDWCSVHLNAGQRFPIRTYRIVYHQIPCRFTLSEFEF